MATCLHRGRGEKWRGCRKKIGGKNRVDINQKENSAGPQFLGHLKTGVVVPDPEIGKEFLSRGKREPNTKRGTLTKHSF